MKANRSGLRAPWLRAGPRLLLAAAALGLCLLAPAAPALAQKGPVQPAGTEESLKQPADFEQCLAWALTHSPALYKSALGIKVRRLDETDSKWEYAPSIDFTTRYFINRPVARPYTLQFTSGDYNPLGAHFALKARRMITTIALHNHMMLIEEGLVQMARTFFNLYSLDRQAELQQERIGLAQRMVAYTHSLKDAGTATGLQLDVAEQALEVARAASLRVAASRRAALNQLKVILGLDPEEKLEVDVTRGREQAMEGYSQAQVGLQQARDHSFDLKVQALKEKLQDMNITLAYTKFLPNFRLDLETSDPLTGEEQGTLYFSVGMKIPLWDGFQRFRNVSRQKIIYRQFKAERQLKNKKLTANWLAASDQVRQADAGLKLAHTRVRLAALREREALINYQSQQMEFPDYAARRAAHLEALDNLSQAEAAYDQAVLELRRLTGDLSRRFIDSRSIWSEDLD